MPVAVLSEWGVANTGASFLGTQVGILGQKEESGKNSALDYEWSMVWEMNENVGVGVSSGDGVWRSAVVMRMARRRAVEAAAAGRQCALAMEVEMAARAAESKLLAMEAEMRRRTATRSRLPCAASD